MTIKRHKMAANITVASHLFHLFIIIMIILYLYLKQPLLILIYINYHADIELSTYITPEVAVDQLVKWVVHKLSVSGLSPSSSRPHAEVSTLNPPGGITLNVICPTTINFKKGKMTPQQTQQPLCQSLTCVTWQRKVRTKIFYFSLYVEDVAACREFTVNNIRFVFMGCFRHDRQLSAHVKRIKLRFCFVVLMV